MHKNLFLQLKCENQQPIKINVVLNISSKCINLSISAYTPSPLMKMTFIWYCYIFFSRHFSTEQSSEECWRVCVRIWKEYSTIRMQIERFTNICGLYSLWKLIYFRYQLKKSTLFTSIQNDIWKCLQIANKIIISSGEFKWEIERKQTTITNHREAHKCENVC